MLSFNGNNAWVKTHDVAEIAPNFIFMHYMKEIIN